MIGPWDAHAQPRGRQVRPGPARPASFPHLRCRVVVHVGVLHPCPAAAATATAVPCDGRLGMWPSGAAASHRLHATAGLVPCRPYSMAGRKQTTHVAWTPVLHFSASACSPAAQRLKLPNPPALLSRLTCIRHVNAATRVHTCSLHTAETSTTATSTTATSTSISNSSRRKRSSSGVAPHHHRMEPVGRPQVPGLVSAVLHITLHGRDGRGCSGAVRRGRLRARRVRACGGGGPVHCRVPRRLLVLLAPKATAARQAGSVQLQGTAPREPTY